MVLLVDMIKAKTSIQLLRHLGIVLIVLPEVITTPFGVVLVLASRYLSRRLEASLNKRLQETLKYYLAHFKRFSDDADGESSAPSRVKRYTQSEEHLISWQYKGSRSFDATPSPLVWQSWRDTRDDIVHHTVDIESLSRRYGIRDGSKVEPGDSHWEVTSGSTKKLMHHSIDMQMFSRRYKADDSSKIESDWSDTSSSAEEVIHHTVNMESLSRRYGIRDGSKVEPGDSHWEVTSGSTKKLMHHSIDMQMFSRRYKADDSSKIESDWSDTSSSAEEVIHHTVNMESLSRRYKGNDSTGADSNWVSTSGTVEGVAHHSLHMRLLSQCYETDSVGPVKVRYHTVDMASLLRRYGSAASSTPALKAR